MPPLDTGATLITADGGYINFVLVDVESIAQVYMQQLERAELIRAVAAGEPASEAHTRIKLRQRS